MEEKLLSLEEVLKDLKKNETMAVIGRWGHYPRAPKGMSMQEYGNILGVKFLKDPDLDYSQSQPFVTRLARGRGQSVVIAARLEDFAQVMYKLFERDEELPEVISSGGHPASKFVNKHYGGKRLLIYFGQDGGQLYNRMDVTKVSESFRKGREDFEHMRELGRT